MNRCIRILSLCFAMVVVSAVFCENKGNNIVPFGDIKYFEKLRWLEYYTASRPRGVFIYFSTPPAEKYYKVKYFIKTTLYSFYDIIGGEGTSFIPFDHPNWKLKDYWLPSFGKVYENAEKKTNLNSTELDGKFVPKDQTNLWGSIEFKTVKNPGQYVGRISLGYNELGEHFISYSPATGTFNSDGLFGPEKKEQLVKPPYDRNSPLNPYYPVSPYTTDVFELQIVSYGNCDEKMILKTSYYTIDCMPEELWIEPNTECECRGENLKIYSSPSMTGKLTVVPKPVKFVVLERKTMWEEIDGELSMWFRVKTEKGIEGWVWGRNIDLNDEEYAWAHY